MKDRLRALRAALLLREGEGVPAALAGAAAFLGMASFYLLRPLREAMGIARGPERLPVLMTGTLLAMLLANPVYGWASARWPRRTFVPWTYRAFGLQVLLLGAAFRALPGAPWLGPLFYTWVSVFNLFVVTVLWSVLTDLFGEDQGRRLFGLVALGGTCGALAGAALTEGLARHGAPLWLLFPASALALEGATAALTALGRRTDWRGEGEGTEPGPEAMEGLRLVLRDPYLGALALFMLLFTTASTVLYVLQGRIVSAAIATAAGRTAYFARLDLASNLITLVLQGWLASRLLRRFGAPKVLLLMPLACLAGFMGAWAMPTLPLMGTFIAVQRALQYGTDRPAREVLFIPLGEDAKYKAKAFIDTFVYRAGDVVGVWGGPLASAAGLSPALVAAALSVAWIGVGLRVGRLRARLGA